jgi:hypothetical protein
MEQISDDIMEFSEMEFWDLLARKFASREFHQKYDEKALDAMDEEERMREYFAVLGKYEKEFRENDFDNVRLG